MNKSFKAPKQMPIATALIIADTAVSGIPLVEAIEPSATAVPKLNPVVISGTRVEQSSFSLPMSADVVEASIIRDGRGSS